MEAYCLSVFKLIPIALAGSLLLARCAATPSAAPDPVPSAAPVIRLALSCDDLLSLDDARAAAGDATAERLPEPVGPAADLVCLWGSADAPELTVTVDRATGTDFRDYRVDGAEEWAPPAGADDGSYACVDGECESYLLVGRRLVHLVLATRSDGTDAESRFLSLVDSVTAEVAAFEAS